MTREDRAEAQLGLRRETGWFWTFIQVETGDGIGSAIDVSMTMEREANSKGDRVTMNLSGRFLPGDEEGVPDHGSKEPSDRVTRASLRAERGDQDRLGSPIRPPAAPSPAFAPARLTTPRRSTACSR
ncbi:cyanase [Methylobacterium symbioticum]|uniref:Cyanate hydratase n=1 Tax=Methylobacterium symbioticum TaxID=2584084 RepID=A0A509ECZ6_9HYPH|nr:Cyanate hydratase [Methylobacterium symbioticum]